MLAVVIPQSRMDWPLQNPYTKRSVPLEALGIRLEEWDKAWNLSNAHGHPAPVLSNFFTCMQKKAAYKHDIRTSKGTEGWNFLSWKSNISVQLRPGPGAFFKTGLWARLLLSMFNHFINNMFVSPFLRSADACSYRPWKRIEMECGTLQLLPPTSYSNSPLLVQNEACLPKLCEDPTRPIA